jgi:hypothetical protein
MTTDERFDRLDRSVETLTRYVLDLRQETAARLQTIENRLDMLASTVANIDSRLPALTKALTGVTGRLDLFKSPCHNEE